MTVERQRGTVEHLIHQTLRHLSPAHVEDVTGLGIDALRKASNPNEQTRLAASVAPLLDVALVLDGKPRAFIPHLEASYAQVLIEMGGKPCAPSPDLKGRLLDVMSEVGDVADALKKALDPSGAAGKNITSREKSKITGEIKEAIAVLSQLEKDLEAL